MRKSALWCIPCAYFLVAAVLNLIGKLCDMPVMAEMVKPALMPLLCATTLAYLFGRGIHDLWPVALLTAAQLFGFAGDTLLIPDGFPFFAASRYGAIFS